MKCYVIGRCLCNDASCLFIIGTGRRTGRALEWGFCFARIIYVQQSLNSRFLSIPLVHVASRPLETLVLFHGTVKYNQSIPTVCEYATSSMPCTQAHFASGSGEH